MTWKDLFGWHFDFQTIYDRALGQARRDALFVEIGCWVGKTVIYLASEAKKLDKQITVWAVDNWKGSPYDHMDKACQEKEAAGLSLFQEFSNNVKACDVEDILTYFHPGRIADPVSSEAAKYFADESCDLIFIDADHSYDAVKLDVLAWYPKLRPGGIIAGHDSNRDSVLQAAKDAFVELGVPGTAIVPKYADYSWIYEEP